MIKKPKTMKTKLIIIILLSCCFFSCKQQSSRTASKADTLLQNKLDILLSDEVLVLTEAKYPDLFRQLDTYEKDGKITFGIKEYWVSQEGNEYILENDSENIFEHISEVNDSLIFTDLFYFRIKLLEDFPITGRCLHVRKIPDITEND